MIKLVSFRVRRFYYDQIVLGEKHEELRRDGEFWRKRLIDTDTPPRIATFVCGKDTHRREITGIRIDTPERVLGRELSAQGKQDIPTDTCIVVSLGDEICPYYDPRGGVGGGSWCGYSSEGWCLCNRQCDKFEERDWNKEAMAFEEGVKSDE